MKKLGLLMMSALVLFSCKEEHPTDYLSFAGKLENSGKDTTLLITGFSVKKMIKINSDGTFKDSLKVAKPDFFSLSTNTGKRGFVYLKNGYNLTLSGDASNFLKSFSYKGDDEGADSNNLMIGRFNYAQNNGDARKIMLLEKEPFLAKVEQFKNGMDSIAKLYPKTNADVLKTSDDQNKKFYTSLETNYDRMHDAMVKQQQAMAKLQKGKVAPVFTNYEDYKGGTKSLKDFRGNYVYIDVWATWCRPCIAQIPYLKKLEKEFEGKNIAFVSISTDNERRSGGDWNKARGKWRKMVKDKSLGGVQLWAGKDESRLSQEYIINGIPRFILIDPEGKIVESNAKRPSDPSISEYFTSLGIK
ncbi:TlpA family protein disulfide reductase [Pseudotenacibaculum haliotis]|uniref:TlpA family protein disulfide reductase n=1 Tax=Pseudotenacibaculum haliotis TaxID=1862138 RepID=A0ABW5LTV7_9FLAO